MRTEHVCNWSCISIKRDVLRELIGIIPHKLLFMSGRNDRYVFPS